MKHLMNILGLCAVSIFLFTSTGSAAFWDTKTLEGTVANVEHNILTIMEQSSDQLKIAVQIQTNDKTEYKQVPSLDSLKKGDTVEVSYKEENGEKIATSIAKIEPTEKGS